MSVERARDEIDVEINLRKRLKGVERAREKLEAAWGDMPSAIIYSKTGFLIQEALRELQPEPRIIDWQKVVDNQLPVRVENKYGDKFLVALEYFHANGLDPSPFKAASREWKCATLETGQWVFNSTGVDPWPPGVVFEIWQDSGATQQVLANDIPAEWWLTMVDSPDQILATRAVGLEEGWSYGGGE